MEDATCVAVRDASEELAKVDAGLIFRNSGTPSVSALAIFSNSSPPSTRSMTTKLFFIDGKTAFWRDVRQRCYA